MSTNTNIREIERAARLENGGRLVQIFQQQIVTSRSANEAQEYRGDRIVVKVLFPATTLFPATPSSGVHQHRNKRYTEY